MSKSNFFFRFIGCLSSLLICMNLSCSNSTGQKHSQETINQKPNLLIIITDQWHGQALGFLNEDPVMTPHLDSFARRSLVLKYFVTNYPVCSPFRAILMSGQYSFINHVYANCNSATAPYGVELSKETVTWSDVLKENGYSLGYIGKWHLDSPHKPYIPTYNNKGKKKWNEWTPPDRRHGFDYWYAYGTYDRHLKPMYWTTDADRMDFHYVNEWEPKHDVDKAIAYLRNENGAYRKEEAPFGLVVSMNPPHTGYTQVPKKYYNLYKDIPIDSFLHDPDIPPAGTEMGNAYRKDIKHYYAAVTGDDEQIGRLLTALKKQHLADNTIVLFISDHGDNLGKHHKITKNNLYEESVRVPFILYWKDHIPARIDRKNLMSMVDVYPTLLDLMGFKNQIPDQVQGESFASGILSGDGKKSKVQYVMGNINPPDSAGGFRAIRTEKYKLAYNRVGKDSLKGFLFNYRTDSFEMHNLYKKRPRLADSLKGGLKNWLKTMQDPFIRNFK